LHFAGQTQEAKSLQRLKGLFGKVYRIQNRWIRILSIPTTSNKAWEDFAVSKGLAGFEAFSLKFPFPDCTKEVSSLGMQVYSLTGQLADACPPAHLYLSPPIENRFLDGLLWIATDLGRCLSV